MLCNTLINLRKTILKYTFDIMIRANTIQEINAIESDRGEAFYSVFAVNPFAIYKRYVCLENKIERDNYIKTLKNGR